MKRLDKWYAEPVLQLQRHPARHPEVAMDHIVAHTSAAYEAEQSIEEIGHEHPEVVFRNKLWWPGMQVNHAHPRCQGHHIRQVGAITAGENVDLVADCAKLAA